MNTLSRRKMLKLGMFGGVATVLGGNGSFANVMALMPTPSETEGPFYPVKDQNDKDADLTQIDGYASAAQGQSIIVRGQVFNVAGDPVENALLDIWQADANGRYRHPRDSNPAKRDPNFQGWAMINSGDNGFFQFKTVIPGAYPASQTWIRPPHIHFKVSKQGYRTLITQMYFPDEKLNESDLLLRNKSAAERALMLAKKGEQQGNLRIYEYNIVLELFRN